MKAKLTTEQQRELDKLFPFEYQGGGYFRMKGVKKGESAPILHGQEAIEYLFEKFLTCLLDNDMVARNNGEKYD